MLSRSRSSSRSLVERPAAARRGLGLAAGGGQRVLLGSVADQAHGAAGGEPRDRRPAEWSGWPELAPTPVSVRRGDDEVLPGRDHLVGPPATARARRPRAGPAASRACPAPRSRRRPPPRSRGSPGGTRGRASRRVSPRLEARRTEAACARRSGSSRRRPHPPAARGHRHQLGPRGPFRRERRPSQAAGARPMPPRSPPGELTALLYVPPVQWRRCHRLACPFRLRPFKTRGENPGWEEDGREVREQVRKGLDILLQLLYVFQP